MNETFVSKLIELWTIRCRCKQIRLQRKRDELFLPMRDRSLLQQYDELISELQPLADDR